MYKIVYDAETQQETQENLSTEDLEIIALAEQASIEFKEAMALQQNNSIKESAVNKLKALGLTEEEAKAIAGI